MARKARSPVAAFRKLLLAVLVLVLAGIAGLFMFGKAGQRTQEKPTRAEGAGGPKGTTLIGEDFDYTFTDGARPVFHIKGESIKADREGTLFLDRVAVTLWDRQGRIFHVESKNASFNRESNEGQLQGNVVLRGPNDLELRTAQLNLQDKGDTVVSDVPVEIHYAGKYIAHAAQMNVDISGEEYTLQGGARVDSIPGVVPPVGINAQRLIYDRQQHWLRAEGGAGIQRGADRLSAGRIYGNLSEDEKALTFVHAFFDIEGETHSEARPTPAKGGKPAPPTTVRFKGGKDLAVAFQGDQNEPNRVDFSAPDNGRVELTSAGGGIVRTLTAARIGGALENRVLSAADAEGGVEIREISQVAGKTVLRQATGQHGAATFKPDGQLATMDLENNVVYHDGQVTATGDHGTLDMEQGRGEFVGNPVVVTSDRGRIEAPRMVYNTDQQIVNARGGVRALLQKVEETALSGTPLAQGEGPVHVESQEAFWRQQPSSFIFRGDVRAWRGENLLLAPELRGDKAANQLNATGGVKTLFYPTNEGKTAAEKPGVRPKPIQVTASELQYSQKGDPQKGDQQKAGVLFYIGNVRVDQEGKTITCQRMEVDLGEDHQARTMICTGDTKVNDPKVGRKISGQKAVYQVSQRQVDITGEPVTMSDKDGNLVNGQRVLYYVDDGRAVVQGKEGEGNPAPAVTEPGKPAPSKPDTKKQDAKKPPQAKPPKPPAAAGARGKGTMTERTAEAATGLADKPLGGPLREPPEEARKLATTNLRKVYRGRAVVQDVSIDVGPGEIVGLLGPNGAGKTTTFYMVVGLTPPDSGTVLLGDEDITELPMYLRAQRGISYLPQEPSVFRRMSVEDNLRAIFETIDLSHAEQERRIDQLIADLGLSKVRRTKGALLSGGERRRVEIARALVISPWYILLDEPFAGIDPIAVLDIQGIIRHLKSMGIGILITDHNVRETLKITDRAYIINNGEILRSGTPLELSTDPQVRKIYLGEDFTL